MKRKFVSVLLLLIAATAVAQDAVRARSYIDMTDEELAAQTSSTDWWAPGYGIWTGTATNNNVFNSQIFDAARNTQDTRLGIFPGMGTCTSLGGCAPPATP